jgi:predicted TIM-barrel fold metal-dependent hydrolase
MLWGSDHPWPSEVPGYAQLPGLVETALPDLGPAGTARVLGGTARALFPRLTDPA